MIFYVDARIIYMKIEFYLTGELLPFKWRTITTGELLPFKWRTITTGELLPFKWRILTSKEASLDVSFLFTKGLFNMQLYSISDEYINYLKRRFPRVYSNKENSRIHTRKYLGAVIEIETHKYYIPLSSPKEKHDYIMVDGKKKVRKDTLIVMRITSELGEEKELIGTLQIGTMIPVPDDAIELYDVEGETDKKYKNLVKKQIIYIRKHAKSII